MALEQQVFNDVSWNTIRKLIEYHKTANDKNDKSVFDSVIARIEHKFAYDETWLDTESQDMRTAAGSCAKNNTWFKRIDHGEEIGKIILEDYDLMKQDCRLKSNIVGINEWIDKKV